jgi:hypothetical protein
VTPEEAENVLVFQASQALPEALRQRHFGGDGFRAIRGMRSRLAHNYLDIEEHILWESVAVDLREVGTRLTEDADLARRTLDALRPDETLDPDAWRRSHLGSTEPMTCAEVEGLSARRHGG